MVEIVIDAGGAVTGANLYRAMVRNQAKLAYSSVGAWLEGRGPLPAEIGKMAGLADNLRIRTERVECRNPLESDFGRVDAPAGPLEFTSRHGPRNEAGWPNSGMPREIWSHGDEHGPSRPA